MDDGQFAVWPGECRVERSLPTQVLREVGGLDHDDTIELQPTGGVRMGHGHLTARVLPGEGSLRDFAQPTNRSMVSTAFGSAVIMAKVP